MSTVNFLVSELRNARRESRGRRWTIEENVVDLILMKRSCKVLKVFEQNRHHAKINSGCVSEKTPELRRRSVKKWLINEHMYTFHLI
jgi:hypothetical protein